ncbi:integrase family protein [Actinobacteria bacterium OK006]|nr:integrase family protein [Actinobacteria bacterium OK006]
MGQSGLPPVRLHDGRHGAGSQAFAAGVAPKVIQAMLGHSSLRMTMDTYTSIMPGLEEDDEDANRWRRSAPGTVRLRLRSHDVPIRP